jgi:hypothetical protein
MTQTYQQSLKKDDLDSGSIEQIKIMSDALRAHHEYCVESDPYAHYSDLPIGLIVTGAFNDRENNGIDRLAYLIESQLWRLLSSEDNERAAKLALLLRDFNQTSEG